MNIKRSEIKNIRKKIKQIYKEALVSYQDGVYYGGDYADVISPRLASILKFSADYVEETLQGHIFIIKLSKNYEKFYESYAEFKKCKTFDRIEIEGNLVTVYAERYSKNILNNLIDTFNCRSEIEKRKEISKKTNIIRNRVSDLIMKVVNLSGERDKIFRELYYVHSDYVYNPLSISMRGDFERMNKYLDSLEGRIGEILQKEVVSK